MKCEDALVRMLDAETRDLVPGAGDLGAHIGSCERCSLVAQTLRVETDRLAVAFAKGGDVVSTAEFRVRRNRVRRVVPIALAASILLVLAIRNQSPTAIETPASVAAAPNAVADTSVATVAERPTVPAVPVLPVLVRMPEAVPTTALAVQAVAVDATNAPSIAETDSATPVITVDPDSGMSATIMRGQHPNVTVVWLVKNASR